MSSKSIIWPIFLNLFVFPGAGQWHFNQKGRALVFGGATVTILIAFTFHLMAIITAELHGINTQSQDIMELYKFSRAISADVLLKHEFSFKGYMFAIGICYILGIADLFWIKATRPTS